MGKLFGIILSILIISGGVYLVSNYYNETYKTSTAYGVTSEEIPIKVQTKDDTGNIVENSYSYDYTVTFVKENGDKQKMNFEISGEDPKPFEPGAYIKAEISKKRVNAPSQITESDIPSNVRVKISK